MFHNHIDFKEDIPGRGARPWYSTNEARWRTAQFLKGRLEEGQGRNDEWQEAERSSLYQFPIRVTKYHRLGGLHNRSILSHNSGGWKSEIEVPARLVPPEGCEEESVPCLFPSFHEPRTFAPWLVGGVLIVSLHIVFHLCMSVSKFPLSIRTPVILDQGPTLLQYGLILTSHIHNNLLYK